MATAKELRLEAKACLELAEKAREHYVKTALIELAEQYSRDARRAERHERELVAHKITSRMRIQ
jgi:hypothetical protein